MTLPTTLHRLGLSWARDNVQTELADAARTNRTHQEFLERLLAGECEQRHARAVERRLKDARLPGRKTMDGFDWAWPKKINRDQVRHLFSLDFVAQKANVVLLGTTGLGKSHIAVALACEACRHEHRVLFTSAADLVNVLTEAMGERALSRAVRRYTAPDLLVVDELGYLPVDRTGADLLFQVLGGRYERGATVITTNRAFKDWPRTFACDSALTSSVLDRLLHHCEPVLIEGRSYRMKDRIDSHDPSS
ncbi:MAG: IS21-like element helper ATPase IstB [Lentisphaeria bacterium]